VLARHSGTDEPSVPIFHHAHPRHSITLASIIGYYQRQRRHFNRSSASAAIFEDTLFDSGAGLAQKMRLTELRDLSVCVNAAPCLPSSNIRLPLDTLARRHLRRASPGLFSAPILKFALSRALLDCIKLNAESQQNRIP
jgi:hypothetical protein